MAVSLNDLLAPQVIIDVVSRIREGQGRLGRWLGFQPNRYDPDNVALSGPNTVAGNVRNVSFRLFDYSRTIAKARAPGTGPATVAPNPVGSVNVECARFHIKIPLSYEQLGNLSPVVGPNSQIDPGGQDYLTRQETFIAWNFNNAVELMSTGMMQDNLWFQQSGDNWNPVIGDPGSGVRFQVPFQIPSGNKSQLNMLGSGNIITVTWSNSGAPIIKNLMAIKAAFAQLTGYALTDIWINSLTWYNVVTNTEVRNTAGSSNTPFAEYDMQPEMGFDGLPSGGYQAILRGDPTVTWHITDEVLATGTDVDPVHNQTGSTGTIVKMVPDNMAFFCTKPSSMWTRMYHGAEYVVENPGMPGALRKGYYFWKEYVTQPSAVDLIGLLNCVPLLYIPTIIAPATVNF